MSSLLSKILETGINVFKNNKLILKNEKYYEISTINECVGKNDDVKIVQNIFLLVFAVLSHPRNNCAVAG